MIGQYPCLDQSTQTRKFPAKSFFLNNYCGYFIKELPNGFLCLDNVIQTLVMLLDFRKAKNTRLAARVFLRFSTVLQHPAFSNHVIQTRKTIRHFFNTTRALNGEHFKEWARVFIKYLGPAPSPSPKPIHQHWMSNYTNQYRSLQKGRGNQSEYRVYLMLFRSRIRKNKYTAAGHFHNIFKKTHIANFFIRKLEI